MRLKRTGEFEMAKAKKELDRFDTNAKRDIPILAKLLLTVITSVIISVLGVAVIVGIRIWSSLQTGLS